MAGGREGVDWLGATSEMSGMPLKIVSRAFPPSSPGKEETFSRDDCFLLSPFLLALFGDAFSFSADWDSEKKEASFWDRLSS